MAMRSALVRAPRPLSVFATESAALFRNLSDGAGRIFSDEERAIESVYIQKMERERLEKLRKKTEKESLAARKAKSMEKKPQEAQKG